MCQQITNFFFFSFALRGKGGETSKPILSIRVSIPIRLILLKKKTYDFKKKVEHGN